MSSFVRCPLCSLSVQGSAAERIDAMCQKPTHAPQQSRRYSITSSAVSSTPGQMVIPRRSLSAHPPRTDPSALPLRKYSPPHSPHPPLQPPTPPPPPSS